MIIVPDETMMTTSESENFNRQMNRQQTIDIPSSPTGQYLFSNVVLHHSYGNYAVLKPAHI
jgi:hypothetical protein